MSLEADFGRLQRASIAQLDCLRALRVTVVEDRPLTPDLAVIDVRGDSIDALIGLAEEAVVAARRASDAAGVPIDRLALHRGLLDTQSAQTRLVVRSWSELVQPNRLLEITELGWRHGREWTAWARGVLAGCDDCQHALQRVLAALLQAWRALLEHADTGPDVTARLEHSMKEEAHATER